MTEWRAILLYTTGIVTAFLWNKFRKEMNDVRGKGGEIERILKLKT